MSYNDYKLVTKEEQNIIRQKFDESFESEEQDLQEIYEKMLEQKQNLEHNNFDGKLNSAIDLANKNIDELKNILRKIGPRKNTTFPNIFSKNSTSKLNNENDVFGKVPHSSTIINHENNQSNNIDRTLPEESNNRFHNNINFDNPQTPPSPARITRRRSPLQKNILANIAESIFSNIKNKNKPSIVITEDLHRNRFHNTFVLHESCQPRRKMITGQIDLIRLLLLFMALRPQHRYCSKIAQLTNSQFDILLNLV